MLYQLTVFPIQSQICMCAPDSGDQNQQKMVHKSDPIISRCNYLINTEIICIWLISRSLFIRDPVKFICNSLINLPLIISTDPVMGEAVCIYFKINLFLYMKIRGLFANMHKSV